MIEIDIVSLFVILSMLMCVIIIPLGERGHSEDDYRALKRRYKKQQKAYLELIDVFEKVEKGES